jgi:hypothetical protein
MLFRLGAYEQLALGLLSTDKLIPAMRLVMQQKEKLSPRVLPAQYFFDKTVEEARRRMDDDSVVRVGAATVSLGVSRFYDLWFVVLTLLFSVPFPNADEAA